jgi:hypothetical protein
MNLWIALVLVVLLAVVYVAVPVGRAMASRYRHPALVRCPRHRHDVTIEVGRAGLAEALGMRALRRVARCPLRDGACREECLRLPEEALREVRV